jgi:uncharacterized protein (TIGR00375 family)
MMKVIADLHIHSRFSRGCSKDLTLANLEKWARVKGVGLLGTGDFTHPQWIQEIRHSLKDDGTGILRTESGFPFVLQTELSLIYSQGGKGRRVHNVVLAPSLKAVQEITNELLKRGRIDYDGRPIFKIPCPEFVSMLRAIDERIEVIPAHIWTPHFAMLGSVSGFDSLKECFGEQAVHIHAIETGLSSDPPMNWRIPELDRISILSFSDLHSYWPWRIGREATVFDIEMTYDSLLAAIRTGKGIVETIEVDPNYGKYHFDGHRNCNVIMSPEESKKIKWICPVCRSKMTVGVMTRVEELSLRPEGHMLPKPGFKYILPLHDVLALHMDKAETSKQVWAEYYKILKAGNDEYDVLLNVTEKKLLEHTSSDIVKLIIKNRQGRIRVTPGYDGVYGAAVFDGERAPVFQSTFKKGPQRALGDFI